MLTLTHLCKYFPNQGAPILNSLSLHLAQGDFCILIGSNGSGKSTLMKCLTGEYALDSGQIEINRQAITTCQRSQHIAIVTQDVNKGTIGELTLLENMILSLSRAKKAKLGFYQRSREKIELLVKALEVNLEQHLDTPLNALSGGQRQMIATLMTIRSKPTLLLLDEHTSALDPKMHKKLMALTAASIDKERMTALMITHQFDDAIQYGNRLIMMHQGQIVLDLNQQQKSAITKNELLTIFHSQVADS